MNRSGFKIHLTLLFHLVIFKINIWSRSGKYCQFDLILILLKLNLSKCSR